MRGVNKGLVSAHIKLDLKEENDQHIPFISQVKVDAVKPQVSMILDRFCVGYKLIKYLRLKLFRF